MTHFFLTYKMETTQTAAEKGRIADQTAVSLSKELNIGYDPITGRFEADDQQIANLKRLENQPCGFHLFLIPAKSSDMFAEALTT